MSVLTAEKEGTGLQLLVVGFGLKGFGGWGGVTEERFFKVLLANRIMVSVLQSSSTIKPFALFRILRLFES